MSTETSRDAEKLVARRATETPRISRTSADGLALTSVKSQRVSEFHVTITPRRGESPMAMVKRLAELLDSLDATVVRQFVFGDLNISNATLATLKQALDTPDLPVTWVEGASCNGDALSGFQVQAISGAEVRTLHPGAKTSGKIWRDDAATHCVLSALGPTAANASAPIQARETFENLQAALAEVSMTMKDVARTWFFLDDILSWYGDFNRVRNMFFEQNELRPGSVPASTGVRGRNPFGSAVTATAWAAKGHDETAKVIHFVSSPRQCAATAYGSAFSRAVEISTGGVRRLLVSGTASIEPSGETAHVGDIRAQIELTMRVVQAILESRGMSFAESSRATAYFKSPKDLPVFRSWLAENKLSGLPIVNTVCEVCRNDLLFELEVDAIAG